MYFIDTSLWKIFCNQFAVKRKRKRSYLSVSVIAVCTTTEVHVNTLRKASSQQPSLGVAFGHRVIVLPRVTLGRAPASWSCACSLVRLSARCGPRVEGPRPPRVLTAWPRARPTQRASIWAISAEASSALISH